METLIIYKSNTGFTKKYVDILERRIIDSKVVLYKNIKKKDLKEAKYIMYLGPLRNKKIEGVDKLLKKYDLIKDKNIFILATGIEPNTPSKKEDVIIANGLNYYHVRFYLLRGGLDISKMSSFKKKIFEIGLKMSAKKENIPLESIKSRFLYPLDMTNDVDLEPMLEVYHRLKIKG